MTDTTFSYSEMPKGVAFVSSAGKMFPLFDDSGDVKDGHQMSTLNRQDLTTLHSQVQSFDGLFQTPEHPEILSMSRAVRRQRVPHAVLLDSSPPLLQIFDAVACSEKTDECIAEPVIIPFDKAAENVPAEQPPPFFCFPPVLNTAAKNQICALADHLLILINQGYTTVSFAGFHSGDGTSTLLLCAVKELLSRGCRILLGDAHQKRGKGLAELLTIASVSLDSEVRLSDQLSLVVMSSPNICAKGKYDLTLLDTGCLVEKTMPDHYKFWTSLHSEGVVLVVNSKRTPEQHLSLLSQRLREHNVVLFGIVENEGSEHKKAV